ncbi:DUF445 family protein [Thermovibrio sp.]
MVEYLIPPAVGALIGYFTNYVAIKMLFKPVKPYYIFGIKVPFTPGLIPSKREKLAQAIGKVVKENLLTEDAVKERLRSQKVERQVRVFVENFLRKIEESPEVYVKEVLSKIEEKKVKELLPTKELKEKGKELVEELFKKVNGKKVRELLPKSVEREVERTINRQIDLLVESLTRELKEGKLSEVIYAAIRENISKIRAVLPIITEPMAQNLAARGTKLVEELIERAANEPTFRQKLSKLLWTKFQELLSKEINAESEVAVKLKEILIKVMEEKIEEYEGKSLKELPQLEKLLREKGPLLIKEVIKRFGSEISQLASKKLLEAIEAELPVILEAINIEELVKNKVNSLPIEEVEEIVLKLIDEELKHITLLGGVLGFLIGLTQLIIT